MPKSAKPAKPAKSTKPSFRPRVTRRDAFFGLHFDLHPHAEDTVLGRDITDANIDKLLIRVAPDYIQYDCKGHAGYTGYPTKVGWPSPGIVKDSLAIWRKVTARHGVPGITSVFGPYVDELLIPQLREAATAYDLDGAWVDGECWAAVLDYSPAAVKAWRTALCCGPAIKPPKKPSDPLWLEFDVRFLDGMFNANLLLPILTHRCTFEHQPNGCFTERGSVESRTLVHYNSSLSHQINVLRGRLPMLSKP